MAEKSSFFTSLNGDRKYKSSDFAEYFSTFIGNGVFPNPSNNLLVTSNGDMTINLSAGFAWINGYMYHNTDNLTLTVEYADATLKRIDRVVLKCDFVNRGIKAYIKKGTFATNPTPPTLERTVNAYELSVADILVENGVISIQQSKITDTRLDSEVCGIVTQTVETIDTADLYNKLQAYIDERGQDVSGWVDTATTQWEIEFTTWFNTIKNILDGDVAGNLANRILELENKVGSGLTADNILMPDGSSVKTSILKNAKEIENLKQSASNGKNIVATAIGSPLQASDTFATMGTKIDTLTENFRNNLASKGIECLPTDKLSVLVNKVSQFKLFQKFPGTSEEIINDRSECTSTDVVGVWQLKRTIPIEEYFHGIRMSYITVGVFGFTSKIEHIRGNQILTSNSTSDQSTKITLDIMDLQVGDKILMYAQTNENYEGNKSYGGWKNLVISYSWRPVEGEEV